MHDAEEVSNTMDRNIRGLSNIKTVQKAKVRSKPRVPGSEYLELYMLMKEKERLRQYKSAVGRTNEQVKEDLEDVERRITELGRTMIQEGGQVERKEAPRKKSIPRVPMKKMTMTY